jgi:Ca2+-binding EF-hand superfamily protein
MGNRTDKERSIMIDVSNLKDVLNTLGFVAHGDMYEKAFPEFGCSLKVDFQAKKLIYNQFVQRCT